MNIEEDPHVKLFFQFRNIKQNTKRNYLSALASYCKYVNLTPTELIEEAEKEQDEPIKMKNRKIKKYLTSYPQYLLKEGIKPSTVRTKIASIKTFYREFDIILPNKRMKLPQNQTLVTSEDILTKEKIQRALKFCNLKYRAIILLMTSSGMGSAELRNLKYQDFLDALEIDNFKPVNELRDYTHNVIGTWRITRIKTQKQYVTFSSPESNRAIIDYLLELQNKGNLIKSSDPLFIGDPIRKSEKNRHDLKLSLGSMPDYFKKINNRAELGKLNDHILLHAHALREYFGTTLEATRMPHLTIRRLMGHSVDKTTSAYFKIDVESMKREYFRILPYLCLENLETVTIESPEYDKLKEGYERDFKAKDDEIRKLKAEKDEEIKLLKEENKLTRKLVEDLIKDLKMKE